MNRPKRSQPWEWCHRVFRFDWPGKDAYGVAVACCLLDHVNDRGVSKVGIRTIKREINGSNDSIIERLRRLEAAGLIVRVGTDAPGARHWYQLIGSETVPAHDKSVPAHDKSVPAQGSNRSGSGVEPFRQNEHIGHQGQQGHLGHQGGALTVAGPPEAPGSLGAPELGNRDAALDAFKTFEHYVDQLDSTLEWQAKQIDPNFDRDNADVPEDIWAGGAMLKHLASLIAEDRKGDITLIDDLTVDDVQQIRKLDEDLRVWVLNPDEPGVSVPGWLVMTERRRKAWLKRLAETRMQVPDIEGDPW